MHSCDKHYIYFFKSFYGDSEVQHLYTSLLQRFFQHCKIVFKVLLLFWRIQENNYFFFFCFLYVVDSVCVCVCVCVCVHACVCACVFSKQKDQNSNSIHTTNVPVKWNCIINVCLCVCVHAENKTTKTVQTVQMFILNKRMTAIFDCIVLLILLWFLDA